MDKKDASKIANKIVSKLASKASKEDIQKIEAKLEKMNRGPVAKVWKEVSALWQLVKDPKKEWAAKTGAIGALLYLIYPFDAVPDVIPVFGLGDDAAVIVGAAAALGMAVKKCKE